MPIPRSWYDAGIAVRADDFGSLAARMGVPEENFRATVDRFNEDAFAGEDPDFGRGRSAYDGITVIRRSPPTRTCGH